MRVKYLLLFLLFFLARPLFSQDTSSIDKIKIRTLIDTLFIDHDRNNWSIRLFTNYRDNSFQLRNTEEKIVYTPNNPYGLGVGFGTRKLILDVGFSMNRKDNESTDRFDFQSVLMVNNHNLGYILQYYKGYNFDAENQPVFRQDIRSFSTAISYMYMFNGSEYSMTAMRSGLARQKKSAITFGLGGFLFLNRISADSSITHQDEFHSYNEEIRIVDLPAIGVGVDANFSATYPFLKSFIASLSLTPGIGLMYKKVETESISYHPNNPLMYRVNLVGLLGYNGKRYYIAFSMGYAFSKTSLDFGNSIMYNTTKAKLALGFKLGKNRISKDEND
jgi:Domain of unknown function (DUF4421)